MLEREKDTEYRENEGKQSHVCRGGEEAGGQDCLSLAYVTGNASLPPSLPACFTTTHMTAAALFCNSSHEDRVVLQ